MRPPILSCVLTPPLSLFSLFSLFSLVSLVTMAFPLRAGDAPVVAPAWDLSAPPGADQTNAFMVGLITTINTQPFDSQKLDNAVVSIILPDNRKVGVATLCEAMTKPDFKGLFGASSVAFQLFKQKQRILARRMLPFLVATSERTQDAEGQASFAFVCPWFRDIRVVPRLTQLLEHPGPEVKHAATKALSQITLVPVARVTPAEMKSWWASNQAKSSQKIWQDALNSKDPQMAMAAVHMLFDTRDQAIVPALCRVLKGDHPKAIAEARETLERISGNDWSYDPALSVAGRIKLVAKIEKWWEDEKGRFQWVVDRNAANEDGFTQDDAEAVRADPRNPMVAQLGSIDGVKSEQAETQLRKDGHEAVPALIAGLSHENLLVRRKCNKVLEAISKQDVGYDPRADAATLTAAIAKWKAWAIAQKILLEPASAETKEEPVAAPRAETPQAKPAKKPKKKTVPTGGDPRAP